MCLKDLLPGLIASANKNYLYNYKGFLRIGADVVASDGSRFSAHDDSTPIASHKVEIKFSEDTKENFKPGLEYSGKVSEIC